MEGRSIGLYSMKVMNAKVQVNISKGALKLRLLQEKRISLIIYKYHQFLLSNNSILHRKEIKELDLGLVFVCLFVCLCFFFYFETRFFSVDLAL